MKVLAGGRRAAPANGRDRPPQPDTRSPRSLVLSLQRSAGNRAVTALLARAPTLKGGQKLDSPADIKAHAKEAYEAFLEYCKTKLLAAQADTWAEEAAWSYIDKTEGEVAPEQVLSALKQRFDEMLPDIPAEHKASAQTPASAPKPQLPLPYGTAQAKAPATMPGPIVPRKTDWGFVWLIWPGIGVEDPNRNEGYAHFLREQLEIIAGTQVGAAVLAEFDPASGSRFRMLAPPGAQENAYAGITALIGEPLGQKQEIRTLDVGELNREGKRETGAKLTIPRISFFSRPADKQEKLIGAGPSKFVDKGLASHRDFPKTVEPFDVVLFHEFGHAFLSQTGYSKLLTDAQEETVVVGLLEAKGVASGENAYRCERKRDLRPSYLDVGVDDPALAPENNPRRFWQDQRTGLREAVAAVLHIPAEDVDKKLKT